MMSVHYQSGVSHICDFLSLLVISRSYTKSVFNSVINSQVMDCFSPLRRSGAPHSPIPFKQDLVLSPRQKNQEQNFYSR